MTLREDAYTIASWMHSLETLSADIDKSSIIPATVSLAYSDVSITLHGCAYKEHGEECFYLIGHEPYETLLEMTGCKDSGEFCIDFGMPYYVSGYLPQDSYDTFEPTLRKKYHPYGPNLLIRESNDLHVCEDRKVIDMAVSYYSAIGSS